MPIRPLAHPAYRPEIDGLRSIAVLGVVLYHFGLPGLPGGFTGVDVFFVISGFLIGGILWRDLDQTGNVSLARFFTRRVKRLAPAYFTMVAAATLAAWFVLLPFELREFGKELIAATTYLSNVLFWRGEGYFDIGADNKVLLHTWSLAVEEQFYIVLPLLILALKASRRALITALVALFVASLAANLALTPGDQTTTFYLFPFRAWELLAGVLLAIAGHTRALRWAFHASLSWLGLGLVLGGLTLVRPEGFPGWQAFAPVIGTALLLANGQHENPVNRLLSSAGSVFIGKISYSFYLWHWPVLVLSTYWRDGYANPLEAALWLLLSGLLATLSWAVIETPIRHLTPKNGWRVLLALAVPSSVALSFGALAYLKDGLPDRFNPDTRAHIAASGDFLQDWSRCHTPTSAPFEGVALCPIGPEGAPRVLIWGDSHVRAIKEGLEQAAQEAGVPALIIWHAGCPPLFGIEKRESYATQAEDSRCHADTETIRASLGSLGEARRLLLVGRWSYYATGTGVGLDRENTIALAGFGGRDNAAVFKRALDHTLNAMDGRFDQVFVFRQPPEIPQYDSRMVSRRLAHGHLSTVDAPVSVARGKAEARAARGEALFAAPLAQNRLSLLDPWEVLCHAETCSALQDGEIWYFDNNHLTNTGARALAPLFATLFAGADPR